jgi:hypothetical protein
MSGINTTQLSAQLSQFGGKILAKHVNEAEFKSDFSILRNVKIPVVMPRLHINGSPRPYRIQPDDSVNSAEFTDKTLTVFQSKMDFGALDPEVYRNTYLAAGEDGQLNSGNILFYQFIAQEIAKQYLAIINDTTVYKGVRNAAGTGALDLIDGLEKLLDVQIAASKITPIATGAITNTNAVDKIETFTKGLPAWLKSKGARIWVSYDIFEKYRQDYRTRYGFTFDPNKEGLYMIDGTKHEIVPRSWMGTSQRLIASPKSEKNVFFGMDSDSCQFHATPELNYIKLRVTFPLGLQIADDDAIFCNDLV